MAYGPKLPRLSSTLRVPRKGTDHQWRKEPPRELSVALVADERLGAEARPKPRDKGRLGRLSNPTGRNVSEA